MFRLIFFIALAFSLKACRENQQKTSISTQNKTDILVKKDSTYLNDKNDWQSGFGLTHNTELDTIWTKPVKYYFENPKCSQLARDFYSGKFRPTDNDSTKELLSLVTTENIELRPFYRWCLNKTIQIQDGALAEYTGSPARQYVEKYPREFFEYMDIDTTSGKYHDWTSSISYSGFYDEDDYKKPNEIKDRMTKKITKNFKNLDTNFEKRITKLVEDCF
jgi:hypothetical protein